MEMNSFLFKVNLLFVVKQSVLTQTEFQCELFLDLQYRIFSSAFFWNTYAKPVLHGSNSMENYSTAFC